MKDMTVDEFNIALRAGLGRCVQFLGACEDKEPYREAVLVACLNDYAYDGQSEGTRAWYTYRLLSFFNDDEFFFSRIQKQLREVLCWRGNNWEFEHLFDLVLEFAHNGYALAVEFIGEIYRELLDCLAEKIPDDGIDWELSWLEHLCIECARAGGHDVYVKIAADLNILCNRNSEYCLDDFDGITSLFTPNDDTKTKKAKAECERDQKCDVNKILNDIKKYDNTDPDGEWHSVAMNIAYNEDIVFPPEAYMYVYTGLCACCRNRVVRAMRRHGLLPDELLHECEFDSYDETREFAESIMQN